MLDNLNTRTNMQTEHSSVCFGCSGFIHNKGVSYRGLSARGCAFLRMRYKTNTQTSSKED